MAVLLRRLRRLPEAKMLMSSLLQQQIFQEGKEFISSHHKVINGEKDAILCAPSDIDFQKNETFPTNLSEKSSQVFDDDLTEQSSDSEDDSNLTSV